MRALALVRALVAGLVLSLLPHLAMADQKDPRLDELFVQLHEADDVEQAQPIQHAIWQLWMQSGSPTVDLLMEKGVAALEERELDLALTMFNTVVELKPDFAEGWNKRATLFYVLNRYEESLRDIERTLKLEPRHFGALSGEGLVLAEMKRPAEALRAFRRALDANPHMPSIARQVEALTKEVEGQKI